MVGQRVWMLGVIGLAVTACAALAAFDTTQVFRRGQFGYDTFRIPAIVLTDSGTLLAIAEGRVNSPSDVGDIDLVVSRSFDFGESWASPQLIHNAGGNTAGNPVPVIDRSTGVIWLVFSINNKEVFVTHSDDDGATWATPTDITDDVADRSWDFVGPGPCHGFQMSSGRLAVPCYRNDTGSSSRVRSYLIYSDDHGATWSRSAFPSARSGEPTGLETEDGRLYLSGRGWDGKQMRAEIFSNDAGLHWVPVTYEPRLPDPPCQASTIRYTTKYDSDRNRLLFCNPPGTERKQLSVRVSYDEALTWTHGRMVDAALTGYSDLVVLPDGNIGVLYERGYSKYYDSIYFAKFDRAWLESSPGYLLWNFDEQVEGEASTANDGIEDSAGGDFHARAVGTSAPTYAAGAPAYGGSSALSFTAGDDKVEWLDGGDRSFDFDAIESFTVELVARTSAHGSGGTSGAGGLVSKDWGPGQASWWMRIQDGNVRFLVSDDLGNTASVATRGTVSDGAWHHIAAVRDAETRELRVYVDHVLGGTASDSTIGTLANEQNITVGAFSNAAREFVGDIDFVKISHGALHPEAFVQPATTGNVIAFWSFEEGTPGEEAVPEHSSILDVSGGAQHGSAEGATRPGYISSGNTAFNQATAMRFAGGAEKVVVADRGDAAFDFAGDESFTLQALIRTTQQDNGAIIAKDFGAGLPSWWWRVENGGRMKFLVCDGPNTASAISEPEHSVSDGQWHHVAAVRNAADHTLRLYVDHALVQSAPDTTVDSLASSQDVTIGDFTSVPRPFNGDIDFVKVTRGALAPTEFETPSVALPSVMGDWAFNERAAGLNAAVGEGKIADSSGRGRSLTALGSPHPVYAQGDPVRGGSPAIHLYGELSDQLAYFDRGTDEFDFADGASFTLEAVIRTSSSEPGGLVVKDDPLGGPGWSWQIESDGAMRISVADGVYNASVRSSVVDSVADDAWHHVAAVRDAGAGQLRLYKDYVLIDSGSDPSSGSLANDKDLLIGALHSTDAGFDGLIDRVRITSAVLTPSEFLACSDADGDLTCDGAADTDDLVVLTECLAGPGATAPPAECTPFAFERADRDGDGDVDLADAAALLRSIVGSF